MPDAKQKLLAALVLQSLVPVAHATSYTVNSGLDPLVAVASNCLPGNAGTCTLRDAIAAAGNGDVVDFLADTTISLVSGHTLELSRDIAISGQGHNVVIDGSHNSASALTVDVGASATIDHLLVRNVYVINDFGGGIANRGTLTLSNSTLVDNQATYGGGIYNAGTLTITNSTIADNHAPGGGAGIWNRPGSMVKLIDSTVSGNVGAWGGAIGNLSGTVYVVNSTLYGNTAFSGGGIRNWNGTVTLINSTLSGNVAEIAECGASADVCSRYGSTTLANTIVADGCGGSPPTDNGGNLDSGTSCGFNAASSKSNAHLELGNLGDNGGPTLTILPGVGSAAIDAGIDAICSADPVNATDQRGMHRPEGSHCDSGAVEIGADVIFVDAFGD